MINHNDVETLLSESQRLRDELMRTAARLEAFSEQLLTEVADLRGEQHGDGAGNSGTDSSGERAAGAP